MGGAVRKLSLIHIFTTAEQIHTGWDHAANAYYAGELGKWNIDFNADYLAQIGGTFA